jgi:hypothetical protein
VTQRSPWIRFSEWAATPATRGKAPGPPRPCASVVRHVADKFGCLLALLARVIRVGQRAARPIPERQPASPSASDEHCRFKAADARKKERPREMLHPRGLSVHPGCGGGGRGGAIKLGLGGLVPIGRRFRFAGVHVSAMHA